MNSKGLFPKVQAVHTITVILKQKQRALKLTTNATWWPIWMCETPEQMLEGRLWTSPPRLTPPGQNRQSNTDKYTK